MPNLLVRNIDEGVVSALKIRAGQHGISAEAEHRAILENALLKPRKKSFAEIAPRALNILSDLTENAESESVRLGAARDLLDRAGFRPVDRHEIVKDKSVVELNAQLISLVGENGAEMLISAFRSRRSISGPELAG